MRSHYYGDNEKYNVHHKHIFENNLFHKENVRFHNKIEWKKKENNINEEGEKKEDDVSNITTTIAWWTLCIISHASEMRIKMNPFEWNNSINSITKKAIAMDNSNGVIFKKTNNNNKKLNALFVSVNVNRNHTSMFDLFEEIILDISLWIILEWKLRGNVFSI